MVAEASVAEEWTKVIDALPQEKQTEYQRIRDESAEKPAGQIQSEFENFIDNLPPNFRTGLNQIVDAKNLTPEQLRGLITTNSIDGMDEIIRAAQFGDTKSAGVDLKAAQEHSHVQENNRLSFVHVEREQLGDFTPLHTGGQERRREKGGRDDF